MVQFSELKKKDKPDLSEEEMKEVYNYITTLLKKRLRASRQIKKSMVIHLRSGETITYLLSDIENISFK